MLRPMLALLAAFAIAAGACGGEEEAEPLSSGQAERYFTNIDQLLDQTVAAHEEGDTEQAAELAGEAYLENYEHLEHDLEEVDAELNEEIEELLGPPFRQAIQEGMTQEEVESRVAEVEGLLEEARAALDVA